MNDVSRGGFVAAGTALAGMSAIGLGTDRAQARQVGNGFMAANLGGPVSRVRQGSGLQGISVLCEVIGGGEKVMASRWNMTLPSILRVWRSTPKQRTSFRGTRLFPGMPQEPDKNATAQVPTPRAVAAIYTNTLPALRPDRKSVSGRYVIAEFAHDADLSLPTDDSDKVTLVQTKPVHTSVGAVYAASASAIVWSNAGQRGNSVVIRSVNAWEQNHWWWDDTRSTWLEYSIYLPKSFLKPGGESKAYPLVLAVTHSGTNYNSACAQTLTEQCIATIWSLPEEQARNECVVVTPRHERT